MAFLKMDCFNYRICIWLMEILKNLRPEWDIVTIPGYVEEAISYFKGKIKLIIRPKYDKEIIISEHRSQLFRLWLN